MGAVKLFDTSESWVWRAGQWKPLEMVWAEQRGDLTLKPDQTPGGSYFGKPQWLIDREEYYWSQARIPDWCGEFQPPDQEERAA